MSPGGPGTSLQEIYYDRGWNESWAEFKFLPLWERLWLALFPWKRTW